jgi:hypothetical protein
MEFLRYTLLFAHILGLAAIIGPALDQLRADTKRITTAMVWGARAQIITGLALVGTAYATDNDPDNAKIAVKLVLALAIVGIAEANRKKDNPVTAYWLVGGLTLVNIAVAVFWR